MEGKVTKSQFFLEVIDEINDNLIWLLKSKNLIKESEWTSTLS